MRQNYSARARPPGLTVVLASSANPPEFAALRSALNADDAIDATTSAGDVEQSKPAPDLVGMALKRAGAGADGAVFVGDTMILDVQACAKVGVPCIGVLSGGIDAAQLRDAGAAAIFDDPADLLNATSGQARPRADPLRIAGDTPRRWVTIRSRPAPESMPVAGSNAEPAARASSFACTENRRTKARISRSAAA